ncbi:hypothetical protein, partial [uncultured Desulfovibrio sp.]|uniref:hypothetical protein n=1 Tax=uncultured Desulfovibrio sp. TaxID=167968 RepID=UPI002609B5E2
MKDCTIFCAGDQARMPGRSRQQAASRRPVKIAPAKEMHLRSAKEEGERALSEAADTVMRMRERPGRDNAGKGSGQ